MKQLANVQEACFKLLPPGLTNTYQHQAKEYMLFQLQMMRSLKLRTEASHQRLQGEINLVIAQQDIVSHANESIQAFNMLASVDNQIMKSITLLTMIFLPATFIAVGAPNTRRVNLLSSNSDNV
jgi:Mg2+ and Co2+ transporter CorA